MVPACGVQENRSFIKDSGIAVSDNFFKVLVLNVNDSNSNYIVVNSVWRSVCLLRTFYERRE